MIAWFAKNSVAANLLMWAIIIGGVTSIVSGITLEAFPPEKVRTVDVSVTLIGATPEDMELGVATRIEQAVRGLEGIDRIISRSSEGNVTVQIEAQTGYDPRLLLDDVKARVDAINTLPEEAEKPVIGLAIDSYETIAVLVSGRQTETEIRQYAELIRLDLLRLDGITHVELESARPFEIAIEVKPDRLREFDIAIEDIAEAVSRSSLDISAGNIRAAGGDILIRSQGQAYRQHEFDSIVVKTTAEGTLITVADVAVVHDGFEELGVITRLNGNHAAIVAVLRVGDQNAIDIAQKVKSYIEERRSSLPRGMQLEIWDDESEAIADSLNIMLSSAVQGSLLVILLLSLFLKPQVAAWVFLGIPISFIGAFAALYWFGITLNLMSSFGFILVLGIVVDDAIVTGENVYSHLVEGKDGTVAAVEGTREVATPVTFGILTTIAAFTPLALIEGPVGELFQPIALVVIPVLILSLIESKLVLPAHLKNISVSKPSSKTRFSTWQRSFAEKYEQAINDYYNPILSRALSNRYTVVAAFSGMLLVTAVIVVGGWVRWVFIPENDAETVSASIQMPAGTPFELTDHHVIRIADAAEQLKQIYGNPVTGESLITNIISTTGTAGEQSRPNFGEVQFELVPREERVGQVTTAEFANEWREVVGPIVGAESVQFRTDFFSPGSPVDVQMSGNSLERLESAGEEVKSWLALRAGVFDISDSLSNGKQELQVELKSQGHLLGLTRNDVVAQISQAFQGLEAQRIQRGVDEIRVIVRYPLDERNTLTSLNEMLIELPTGSSAPFMNVAELVPSRGPATITRIDQNRVLNVTANINKEIVNLPALQSRLEDYLDSLLVQYPSIDYSLEGEEREERRSLQSLFSGFIIALGVIYSLLALPLKSYIQPILVMTVIPFGLIGAIAGHMLMGYPISLASLLGMVALIGVVINDSLVLVDFANQRFVPGSKMADVVRGVAIKRFRPVMLTSLTTFFGLLPLLLEQSTTAQLLIPMGISLGFGILFATLITLILVPSLLLILDDFRSWTLRIRVYAGSEQA